MRAISFDVALLPHIGDAITQLANTGEWKEVGDTVEDVVAEAKEVVEKWYSDMLIGSVFAWVINPPGGWLLLDGSTYANADYPELAALLPAHLISGANFTLPDVEESFPFGVIDEDDGATVAGNNVLNLTTGQLPSHTHTYTPPTLGPELGAAGPPLPSAIVGTPTNTGATGDGDDIDTRPKRFGLLFAVFAGRE